jgi:hypothetical protein
MPMLKGDDIWSDGGELSQPLGLEIENNGLISRDVP